jgi:hypothetical protein
MLNDYNRILCMNTTFLSSHRCLIMSSVETEVFWTKRIQQMLIDYNRILCMKTTFLSSHRWLIIKGVETEVFWTKNTTNVN